MEFIYLFQIWYPSRVLLYMYKPMKKKNCCLLPIT